MAGNLNNSFIMHKVRRITRVNIDTGVAEWTLTNLEDVQIEFTGETTDKKDAQGTLIAKFDKAKGLTISGEGALIDINLLDSQVGGGSGDVANKIFEVLSVTNYEAELSFTPSVIPQYVYYVNSSGDITGMLSVGTSDEEAAISGNTLILPDDFTDSTVGVFYEVAVDEDSAAIVQVLSATASAASKYASMAEYMIEFVGYNPKEPNLSYAGTLVLPRARLDNNVTIELTTEGTHPFKIEALRNWCSSGEVLCYTILETPCRISVLTDEELEELLANVYGSEEEEDSSDEEAEE